MQEQEGCRIERRPSGTSEVLLLAMACFAPWAFGAVDAWAEFVLELGIALVTIQAAITGLRSDPTRRLLCLPSLALAGLVLLAAVQAAPLPAGLLGRIDHTTAALRRDLVPSEPERILGDERSPVALPASTLSLEPGATLVTAARLASAWLLFQGVLGLGSGPASLRRFGLAIAVNATLLALVGLVQALTWNGKLLWIRPAPHADAWASGGPFACHSHFAASLNLGLGFALGFLLAGGREGLLRQRSHRPWAAYAAGVLIVGIVTSQSRGGFLAMVAAAAVLLVGLLARSARVAGPIRAAATMTAMLGLAALFLLVLGDASPYQRRLATILDPGERGYSVRAEIWGVGLRAWRDHPLWGTGLGSFAAATAPYFDQDYGVFFARAENEYVDLLVEGGLIGLGLGLMLLVGVARLGLRALAAAPTPRDRATILGGMFGLLALAFHSLSDFGPHVPGVAVPAVILCGHLGRLGLATRVPRRAAAPATRARRLIPVVAGPALAISGVVLAAHGFGLVRLEGLVAAAGLPLPGTSMPTAEDCGVPGADLERMREALERALRLRPGWTEGHLRLGMTCLGLYERTAAAWVGEGLEDPAEAALLADPLWLLGVAHSASAGRADPASELLAHEPIRRYLVPAARSFLEARRCCPVSALAHAKLASLDFLYARGDPASAYVGRALRLAGADERTLAFAAQVAVQVGDLDLATRCWRRSLEVRESNWPEVADSAAAALPPDRILERVVPSGRHALWFADRLYAAPADRPIRERFLREAVARLPNDRGLPEAERLRLEARAWAELDTPGLAGDRMKAALSLEPRRGDWRGEYIEWLLGWGQLEEAHSQALLGVHFNVDYPGARRALDRTAEALAGGVPRATGTGRTSP